MVAHAARSALATAAVSLLLLSILPALPCERAPHHRDARSNTADAPRKPAHPAVQPAALPKLALGAENCVDMFGAGVGGGGENQPDHHTWRFGAIHPQLLSFATAPPHPFSHPQWMYSHMPTSDFSAVWPLCVAAQVRTGPGRCSTSKRRRGIRPPTAPATARSPQGWVAWQHPGDRSTRDPTQNGGVQALIDLKAIHAVSDIWMNHFSGNAWARLEIFLRSPFDAEPVWSADINNSQVNGVPVNEPPVCNGWARAREPAASLFMLLATSFGIPVERTRNLPTVPG